MVRFSTCTMYSSFLLWSLYHRWNSHRTHKGLNNPIWSGIWGELDCWLSVCMKTMALAFSLQKDEQKLRERPDPPHTQGFSSYPGGQGGTSRPLWNQVVPELLAHCQRGKQTFAVHNHWGLDGGGTAFNHRLPRRSQGSVSLEALVQGTFPRGVSRRTPLYPLQGRG